MYCCFKGTILEFLGLSKDEWLEQMKKNYSTLTNEAQSKEQIAAWNDCYEKSLPFFKACIKYDCYIIFEYLLPREGGRRPDVLLLSGEHLFVLEYKMKESPTQADLDQVFAYARDLKNYHSASHSLTVTPVLVLTKAINKKYHYDNVYICSPDKLEELIIPKLSNKQVISLDGWLKGEYAPLPSLVEAAKAIYQNEDLPYIRKAHSAGIPQAVDKLISIAEDAKKYGNRVLALVTGVPGSGKTLLGLDFVHKTNSDFEGSIFLSGNGPLVKVLQYALKNKTFVSPLRNFVIEYGIKKRGMPKEHIIVFDEAQRAWDKDHVFKKHNVSKSEPELIIEIVENISEWSFLVGLVGEGQEIHVGEETGISQWRDAIVSGKCSWTVVCPPKLKSIFEGVCCAVTFDELDLTVSLRSHLAEDVTKWVDCLLDENIEKAAQLSQNIHQQGSSMYITRCLDSAKRYCKKRYANNQEKRYGLICSSKAKILPKYGIDNSFNTTKNLKIGPWYNEPVVNPLSCCQLDKVATEFACQGLELDMPIICWGEDLQWNNGSWKRFVERQSNCKDPHRLRMNSYRVLLTRGRDGFVVYVPNDESLSEIYETLKKAGLKEIRNL